MRDTFCAITVGALLAGFPLAAAAQVVDDRRIEIGGGLGTVGSWWSGPYSGGDVRVGVRVGDRGAVETLVGLSPTGHGDEVPIGFYGVQFRHDLRPGATSSVQPFLTYGGIGVFGHQRGYDVRSTSRDGVLTTRHVDGDSFVTPPFIGLVGGGVQRRVAQHLTVRLDAQAVVLFILPVGVRVAAGVSVPLGRVPAVTR
jgi:hypothetical protein